MLGCLLTRSALVLVVTGKANVLSGHSPSVCTESGRGLAYPAGSILLRLPQTLGSTLGLPCKGTQTGWGIDRRGGQEGRV